MIGLGTFVVLSAITVSKGHKWSTRSGAGTAVGWFETDGRPAQEWTFGPSGQLSAGNGMCLQSTQYPVSDGTGLTLSNCSRPEGPTRFRYIEANSTLVLVSDPAYCVNLAGYGNSPGTQVWLYRCSPKDCKSNCIWRKVPSATAGGAMIRLVNSASGLVLDGGLPAPTLPQSCAPETASSKLPFCDYQRSHESRVADLVQRLSLEQKVQQYSVPVSAFKYNGTLNLKGYHWDYTCMRGIARGGSPILNTTVFPHAVALAATFDTSLVAAVGNATAHEGRIVNDLLYNASFGTSWQGVQCDGGPLANTAHDPRWGRISECYGEDPRLAAIVGTAALHALQQRRAVGRDEYLLSSQVTRHWLGFHGASPDLPRSGEETIGVYSFQDQQAPAYRSFQVDGGAEGIMCAMSSFNITGFGGGGGMIPSCVHPYLWEQLRGAWASKAFVQTDCCSSISEAVSAHHFYPNISEAVAGFLKAGVQASYGPDPQIDRALLQLAEQDPAIAKLLDEAVQRTFLTRFRLGEFDTHNPSNPFRGPWDASELDGARHRQLAREAAARSVVLLRNRDSLLPLEAGSGAASLGLKVAVIGPFADCTNTEGGYGIRDVDNPLRCSYLHSYAGQASTVSTVMGALRAELGVDVAYSQGTNILTNISSSGIQDAADAAAAADVAVLVLGTGTLLEKEGLDRTTLRLPAVQEQLLAAISSRVGASRVVLLIQSAGPASFDASQAGAVMVQGYGGEETGSGFADVVMGRVAPSGRLPVSMYTEEYLSRVGPLSDFNMVSNGTGRTYRYLPPDSPLMQFTFGFGLSYASFRYSGLSIDGESPFSSARMSVSDFAGLNITVTVQRVQCQSRPFRGEVREVVQAYVASPQVAPEADGLQYGLAAVQVVPLPAGGASNVTLQLPLESFLSTTSNGTRALLPGTHTVYVSGHAPLDPRGVGASNTVKASVEMRPN